MPGMVTARPVFGGRDTVSRLPLIAAPVTISEAIREKLLKSDVDSIMIEDDLSEGIAGDPPITQETRRSALAVVNRTFDAIRAADGAVSARELEDVEGIISVILAEISGRRSLLVCLSDLNVFGGARMQHAVNVCVVGCAVARRFLSDHGWTDYRGQRREDQADDRLAKLGIGLLLQDIGMLALPETIWHKRGLYTSSERELMQRHPALGTEMLEGSDVSPLTKVTVAQHHERFDGSGYPRGLAGDQLHDNGQIAAISDAYVGLCAGDEQAGQKPMAPNAAYELILQASGRLFAPEVVDSFAATIAPFGAGSSVQLSDGRYAIVVENNAGNALAPVVRVTHEQDGSLLPEPVEVDLSDEGLQIERPTDGLPTDAAVRQRA